MMDGLKLCMITIFSICLAMVVGIPLPPGYTCEDDVFAINNLYMTLGYPLLPGWMPFGGDPCLQGWQGVQCVGPNITAIVLNGANLGGELGDNLANFTSIITIDLSNNHIGGSIPYNLPLTLRQLDVSSNNLSGPLPPSMTSLSSLATLHLQNNSLSGTLDVLQDLPLIDLDIENNLFSGPVPASLWNIPNFISKGNPFNATIVPSPEPSQALPSLVAPVPPPYFDASASHGGKFSTINVIAYAFVAIIVIVVVLLVLFCASKLRDRQLNRQSIPMNQKKMAPDITKDPLNTSKLVLSNNNKEEFSRYAHGKQQEREVHMIETSERLRPIPAEKVVPKHVAILGKDKDYIYFEKAGHQRRYSAPAASLTSFSVALLQQYTNYFREENLIRNTYLGKVYMAELSGGKISTVLKLNNLNLDLNTDDFDELVSRISELRHQNIVEIAGYCSEFGQRILVFKYFSRTTLHDLLHDFLKKRLSWNARIQIALATAKAVEYLHEFCKPSIILRNIRATCILVDDELSVCISECGLASYVLSNSFTQFSGDPRASFGYEAPEISESGSYTDRSDVYSFGVVMLELLTGRQPYDNSRSLTEQHLERWASTQLYDINALSRMVDPFIDGVVSLKSLSRFADVISRCIQKEPEFRPAMSQIAQDLSLVLKDARIST